MKKSAQFHQLRKAARTRRHALKRKDCDHDPSHCRADVYLEIPVEPAPLRITVEQQPSSVNPKYKGSPSRPVIARKLGKQKWSQTE